MNAFQLLKNDHKIVSALFDKIESASGRSKAELFARLKSELDVHAHIEEKVFYPALENKQESREITLEAYEEHKVVKDLLTELASGRAADEEWDAKLKVLRENVDHHVEEEEGELFDKASDVLSDEDIERLGDEMEAEKARKQGLPQPAREARGSAKRSGAKSGGSRKQAQSPGVLKRLANFVGLGEGSSRGTSKASSGGSRKKATKADASKKSSSKSSTKKSAKKKAGKTASKASGSRKAAARPSSSRTASKKATKRSGGSKRKAGGSKKR
jgi:hypothetical protein